MVTSTRPLTLKDFEVTEATASVSGGMVAQLLSDQQQLTAVEDFSNQFQRVSGSAPAQARHYSKLMPASAPGAGQQYAFEVDLDRCSGCKSCVTACHSLNGLDESETWRDVGLLIGGTESNPVMQHVTTACHHCVEPGCLIACPVNAYEKDPATGIVKHLDDQCFGCQYCTLACPYNVPKYHKQKGIVRKCDMCSDRLSQGEAPACVQACPHEAIAIRLVDIETVKENAEVDPFLPAAPEPYLTLPTTNYKTSKVFPRNTLPADYFSISPQHPHWPLILMLVLTQLSVGAFTVGAICEAYLPSGMENLFRPFHAASSLLFGLVALGASTLHLGRPLYAFRGFLGFRHSWLSREIVAFGLFAGLAVGYAALTALTSGLLIDVGEWKQMLTYLVMPFSFAVIVSGLLGVFCSVMIYVFTKREFWNFDRTLIRFVLTAAVLGIATTLLSSVFLMTIRTDIETVALMKSLIAPLSSALIIGASSKLLYDAMLFRHLFNFRYSSMKRSAMLYAGALSKMTIARFVVGGIGGVLLPILILNQAPLVSESPVKMLALVGLTWIACIAGELFERYLFFAAVSAPRMPGGVRA